MKLIEVVADAGHADTVASIAEQHESLDFRLGFRGEDGRQAMRLLVPDDKAQAVLDALQGLLSAEPTARVFIVALEAALPHPPESEEKKRREAARAVSATREALYETVSKNVQLDANFLVLTTLSTIVAAIGLIEDNLAVVIGAMVIAPLLGPNLALAFGTSLGDVGLMKRALKCNAAGLALAVLLSVAIGIIFPGNPESRELLARTDVGLDSVALALASGAAAALSVTTGLPSVLVGVMVAVALLPPAATFGLMMGYHEPDLAVGAGLLLAVNIVSVNLAAKIVLLLKGISPRTWVEKEKARRATLIYIVVWALSLLVLVLAIYGRRIVGQL